MEIRLLAKEEWPLLQPIFEAEGGNLPDPEKSYFAVAMDGHGIAGLWCLQMMWHKGPLWIRPDQRGTGLWRKLHGLLESLFESRKATGYYSFSGEPKVEAIMRQLGYEELPYKVWKRELKGE